MRHYGETAELDARIAGRYPRAVRAKDGTQLVLTPLVPSDWQLLEALLRETPPEERQFFRHDEPDAVLVERWCSQLDYRHVLPLLAWSGSQIVADGILERETGIWTSHVGKVRLLVHPRFRRQGAAGLLMSELAEVARLLGLHKLVYECAADQRDLLAFLAASGFREAARLGEFIRDRGGRFHDLVLMVRSL